jgi:hypothetical protein
VCIQASFFPSLFRLFLLRVWLAPGDSTSFPLFGDGMGGGAQSSMGRRAAIQEEDANVALCHS